MRCTSVTFIFTLLLVPSFVSACLNEYNRKGLPLTDGKLNLNELIDQRYKAKPYWSHGFDEEGDIVEARDSLTRKLKANTITWQGLSDLAVLELKIGDRKKAVAMLEKLYTEHPKEYNVLANLGTAYELTGDDSRALELLKKAVAVNPGAHAGSEWIHVRILEEKLAGRQYQHIIDLGIKDFATWITDKNYVFKRPADSLKVQIAYQLHERISFVAPSDAIVGQLVFDFADIVAKTEIRNEAIPFYNYAVRYDSTLTPLRNTRLQVLQEETKVVNDTFRWASIVWAIPLVAFAILLAAWIRSIRQNRHRPE